MLNFPLYYKFPKVLLEIYFFEWHYEKEAKESEQKVNILKSDNKALLIELENLQKKYKGEIYKNSYLNTIKEKENRV